MVSRGRFRFDGVVHRSGELMVAVRVLGGRYELVAFVGRGGMGEVWEGRDRVIERRVAVKLLPYDRHDTFGADLFFREARTAGRLSHAGVVTVFDLGQDPDDGTLYLVMEYVTGRDVGAVLREDGPGPVATAADWTAQTAAALHAAHTAGVVHRDLKPANLMLGPDGRIKILDFGIARYMAATHKSSKVIGTLAYMPPERFDGLPGDPRSDLYSLGCVLHELLTGHTPFQAVGAVAMMAAHVHAAPVAPGRTRAGVPAALDDLVLALLAKDPDHRPASAAEVHQRLAELPTGPGMSGAATVLSGAGCDAGAALVAPPLAPHPPFWFAVPTVRSLSDPVTGDETRSLVPGDWYLTVARLERGFLVEVDGTRGVLADIGGIEYGHGSPPPRIAGPTSARCLPPFWFAVPSVRPVSDPATGRENGLLEPGDWFLAVAWHGSGFLVEVDGTRSVLADIDRIQYASAAIAHE